MIPRTLTTIFALFGFSVALVLLVTYLADAWHRLARRSHRPRLTTPVMVHPQIPRAIGKVRQRIPRVEDTREWSEMARRFWQ